MSEIRINVVGAGRVGKTLISLLDTIDSCSIQDVLSTSSQSAHEAVKLSSAGRVASGYADMRPADLWIISVPDTQISAVAHGLKKIWVDREPPGEPQVAFHCSGYLPAQQLEPLRSLNWHLASVHPVMSFADPQAAAEQFKEALCGLEGDEMATAFIQPLLEKLGAKCFPIRSENKSLYHAAAVISNNFTVVLQAIAREAWAEAGVADEIARKLNAGLLNSTVENIDLLGPQDALTGPAARGDEEVVTRQGTDVAAWHPAAGEIYIQLSTLARKLKVCGSTRQT
ncbi:Rossmann-like and DUF2520 domain-containing protein [uncultured Ruegeria sp.]|uniref:Rossmann-like and DUF2520 domain-containing protein n=1 Tax=uncultured Ruegeria sp. TaxID=259304 RepID=UPI0026089FFB|nr:Rossmann-like and DUF2520 domain-containing protein [uncultured Ruegeria sp.]